MNLEMKKNKTQDYPRIRGEFSSAPAGIIISIWTFSFFLIALLFEVEKKRRVVKDFGRKAKKIEEIRNRNFCLKKLEKNNKKNSSNSWPLPITIKGKSDISAPVELNKFKTGRQGKIEISDYFFWRWKRIRK